MARSSFSGFCHVGTNLASHWLLGNWMANWHLFLWFLLYLHFFFFFFYWPNMQMRRYTSLIIFILFTSASKIYSEAGFQICNFFFFNWTNYSTDAGGSAHFQGWTWTNRRTREQLEASDWKADGWNANRSPTWAEAETTFETRRRGNNQNWK